MPKAEDAPGKPVVVSLFPAEERASASAGPVERSAFEAWNEYARKFGWPEARFLTSGRPAKLKRTVKDVGGLAAWRDLLERSGASDFLCGRTQSRDRKPFKLTLDWAITPANLLKLLEGNFLPQETVPISIAPAAPRNWRAILEKYKKGGWWHTSYGPRPEENGMHLAPPDMILKWREHHGIVSKPTPVQETAEDRMRTTIRAYTEMGRHADARRVEAKLAALEGRPEPVFAPAGAVSAQPEHREPIREETRPAVNFEAVADEPPAWDGDVPE